MRLRLLYLGPALTVIICVLIWQPWSCGEVLFAQAISLKPNNVASSPSPAQIQYRKTIKPFIESYCADCHNPQKKKGKLSLHDISGVIVKEKNASLWATILDQIEHLDMPPEEAKKQPNGKARKLVMDWIRAELGHAGFERDPHLLARPEFGNHVNHEKLFNGSIKTPSYSLPRVWRLRAELVAMGSPFPDTEYDYAAMQSIGEPETMRLRALSETIADQMMEFMLGRKKPHRNSRHNPEATRVYKIPKLADVSMYTSKGAIDRKNIDADINTLFAIFLHRKPSAPQRKRYGDFLQGMLHEEKNDPEGRESALVTVMRALVLTPESIYRMELGVGPKLPDGRRILSEQELAIAVPMSLGHKQPIHGLKSRDDVQKAVRKILATGRRTNGPGKTKHGITPRFLEFMRQYFGYHKATDVFKGDRHAWHHVGGNKNHTAPMRLVEETDRIVASILREDKDVFVQLLTFDRVIVSLRTSDGPKLKEAQEYYKNDWRWNRTPIKKASRSIDLGSRSVFKNLSYMEYYGLKPQPAADQDQKKQIRPEGLLIKSPVPRAGILTQPSWLIAHSTFTDNHVVLRGKWVREKLLGGSIPEVPIGVDAAIPDDEDIPLRTRLKSTRQDFCWRCHHRMDPLGYPFEMYDDFGRYRALGKERLINGKLSGQKLDTSGEIINSGAPGIDGPVKDATEMIHKIANTHRARQVFVRHVFRFFMGRNETLADSQTLIAAEKAYAKTGGSFEELVVSILSSDSFLYRKDPNFNNDVKNRLEPDPSKKENGR
jgi:hypothetical protein